MLPWLATALALVVAVVALVWPSEPDPAPIPRESIATNGMQTESMQTMETQTMETAMEAIPVGEVPTSVTFVTQPLGARVMAGDTELCPATPCDVDLPPESITVSFHKRGYRPEDLTFTPDGSEVSQTLTRRPTSAMMGSSLPSIMMEL